LHVLACVCLPTLEFSPKHPETNSKAVTITRHVCAEMSMNLPRFAQFMVHHIAKLHGNLCLKCTKIRGLSLKFVVSSRSPDVSCLSQPKKKTNPSGFTIQFPWPASQVSLRHNVICVWDFIWGYLDLL
jgi:hypothetical protein